jgi:Bacterial regulatory proteins, luxR family
MSGSSGWDPRRKVSPPAARPARGLVDCEEWSWFANKQTAGELGTSEITIGVHRGQIMRKMGARSLAELVRLSDKLGIPPAPGLRRD